MTHLQNLCFLFLHTHVCFSRVMLPPGNTLRVPPNPKLQLLPGHFRLLILVEQKAKKGITILVGITVSDYHKKLGFLLPNGGREEYVCHSDDPLGCLLVLPCLMITVNGQL